MNPRRWIFFLGLLSAVLVGHAARYWPFLPDDALISLRYARRLGDGLGLTWTGGDRVEGYSNLLWILLTALPGALGAEPIWTARAFGFLGVLLSLCMVSLSVKTLRPCVPRGVVGGLALVLSAPVAVWAIGGMEQALMLGVLAAALVLGMRSLEESRAASHSLLAVSALLAALALLRLDGVVLALGMAIGALVGRPGRQGLRTAGIWSVLPLASLAGQSLFRFAYYGTWSPHTARVKVAFTQERFQEGLLYLWHGTHPSVILIGLALASAFLLAGQVPRGRLALPASVVAVWTGYVAVVGGDIFPAWRQLLVLHAPFALLVAEAAEQLPALRPRIAEWVRYALPPLAILHATLQDRDSENRRVHREDWVWDGEAVGDLLRRTFGARHPLLAVDAAGSLPYWSGLESLDMLGLNDGYLVDHPPPGFGHGPLGHELGDGTYVWGRRPDLIVFGNASGYVRAPYRSGHELLAQPGFFDAYQLVRARAQVGNRAQALVWVRRSDGPLGVVRTEDRIEIPGYFFASEAAATQAELDASNRLVTQISGESPGVLPLLDIPQGTWKVVTDPPLPGGTFRVSCPRTAGGEDFALRIRQHMRISFALTPAPGSMAGLRSVTLLRSEGAAAGFDCG